MKIAIVQSSASSWEQCVPRIREAAAEGAHIVLTPEMSLTGYDIDSSIRIQRASRINFSHIEQLAAELGIYILVGFPEEKEEDSDEKQFYNAAAIIGPEGVVTQYRKLHLYGDLDRTSFIPGNTPVAQCQINGLRVGVIICYDVEFPELVRAHALAGTQLLLVPTGLMKPYGWVASDIVKVRAIESQLFIAYANRVGKERTLSYAGSSRIFSPTGETLAAAGEEEELLYADIDLTVLEQSRAENTYLSDIRTDIFHPS